jgi:large subunit ribosomal protein L35
MREKSHSGMTKRFKMTAKGRIRASRAGYQHKRTDKRASRKRQARKGLELVGAERARVKRLLSA